MFTSFISIAALVSVAAQEDLEQCYSTQAKATDAATLSAVFRDRVDGQLTVTMYGIARGSSGTSQPYIVTEVDSIDSAPSSGGTHNQLSGTKPLEHSVSLPYKARSNVKATAYTNSTGAASATVHELKFEFCSEE